MGRLLSEKEVKQFCLYYHRDKDKNNGESDHCEGDMFFNEGDNCVVSYENDPSDSISNSTMPSDGGQNQDAPFCQKRLLIVANRLPVSAIRRGENKWQLDVSVGGLVSALLGLKGFEARWIGWPGVNVPDEVGQATLTKALAEKRCIPVFLDEETIDQYYNGYCNKILWPLLHYFGLPQEDRLSTTQSFQSQFDMYKKANQMFADAVCKHYNDGDLVWCHDYHLMFLPQCLKEYNSKMKVGWFLHTPFPSSEIHRTLPSRLELLRSVLAADVVGFHTYDYARHFVSACTRILGLEGTPEGVENQGKLTKVAAFPIGIDADRFIQTLELQKVQDYTRDLRARFAGRKLMLGVDRLDMIKGIPQKILAFEKFLEENPDWCHKVVLLQIAVPTRIHVPEYQKLASQVHEMVGRINGRFGTLTSVPIHHLDSLVERLPLHFDGVNVTWVFVVAGNIFCETSVQKDQLNGGMKCPVSSLVQDLLGIKPSPPRPSSTTSLSQTLVEGMWSNLPGLLHDRSLDFYALCALYSITDVALVTSLRDGMNLVSYEFVACQASKKGVLILSEFAGAAQSLGAGAILVNPWNISEVACSISYALNMPSEEREKRHEINYTHVTTHSAQEWAKMFVSELDGTVVEARLRTTPVWERPSLPVDVAIEHYVQSEHRLLILGFNATLTQPSKNPSTRGDQIIDMELNLHPNLHEILRRIGSDPKTTIIVLSGSDRNVLDENFGSYNMWLAAENGIFLRHTKGDWMTTMPECSGMEWIDSIKPVFEYFTKRTPRSYFVHRETSLLWNYKYADIEFGRLQAKDLLLHLWTGPVCSSAVDVFQGARSVEVRAVGVTKGAAIDRILAEIAYSKVTNTPIDNVLCIGHFHGKDEDIYSFFEPEPPVKTADAVRATAPNINSGLKSLMKSDRTGTHRRLGMCSIIDSIAAYEGKSVLDLKGDNYFSCAVGRKHTSARYVMDSSEDVVLLLKGLAEVSSPSQ